MDLLDYCKQHRRNKSQLSSQAETSSSSLPELQGSNNLPSCWTLSSSCVWYWCPQLWAQPAQECPTLPSRGQAPSPPMGDAPPAAALSQGHVAGFWSSHAPGPSGLSVPAAPQQGMSWCRAWLLPRARKLLSFIYTLAFLSRLGSL